MDIKVRNLLADSSQRTFLSLSEDSGVGTIRVQNINGFGTSDAIQIGKTKEERSEVLLVNSSAVAGTGLSLTGNTLYSHPADTPVYNIGFDQIVFMRSTVGTSGTATPLTNGTINITPDSEFTIFDDNSGAVTYAYKTKFRNSVTTTESSDSDWQTSSGFSFYSLAKIRERIKSKLFNAGYLKDDGQIDDWTNEWLETMNNEAVQVDKSYSLGTVDVAFADDGYGTITSSDFKDLKRIWVTYNGNDKYRATKRDVGEILPNEVFSSTHPYYSWRGDTVFEVQPPESGGTAEMIYYKRNPVLVNDTDELPNSMKSFTTSFVNYSLAEAYYNDEKDVKGDRYLARAERGKLDFIKQITPRSYTDVQMMEMPYDVHADDDLLFF